MLLLQYLREVLKRAGIIGLPQPEDGLSADRRVFARIRHSNQLSCGFITWQP
jgi:hypothetical protein